MFHSSTMPDVQDERAMDAPDPPAVSDPTKCSRNSDAGHAASDAEGMVNESRPDVEIQRDKEQGKKRKYQGYLYCRIIGTWVTGDQGQLDDTDNDHELCKSMERFMNESCFFRSS